jgi:hypothetical protein
MSWFSGRSSVKERQRERGGWGGRRGAGRWRRSAGVAAAALGLLLAPASDGTDPVPVTRLSLTRVFFVFPRMMLSPLFRRTFSSTRLSRALAISIAQSAVVQARRSR